MSSDTKQVWPDDLEVDDRVEFDGNEYIVSASGTWETELKRVDDKDFRLTLSRVRKDVVKIKLWTAMTQEEFGHSARTNTSKSGE